MALKFNQYVLNGKLAIKCINLKKSKADADEYPDCQEKIIEKNKTDGGKRGLPVISQVLDNNNMNMVQKREWQQGTSVSLSMAYGRIAGYRTYLVKEPNPGYSVK